MLYRETVVQFDRSALPDDDAEQRAPVQRYARLVARSAAMLGLIGQLRRLEPSLATVLIEGESGTGKELVTGALHEHSRVSGGPLVAINCAALDPSLARSELFGHRKGAFTGAIDDHAGAFEAAAGGTLFLDEIGEVPGDLQAMLLRAVETRSVRRLGETCERKVAVRVVAATNRDLAARVRSGEFREDLYFRLSVVRLRVPSLRERRDDIAVLARELCLELGLPRPGPALEDELAVRTWRGNVRELRNALEAHAIFGVLPGPAFERRAPEPAHLDALVDPSRPYAEQKARLMRWFHACYFRRLLALTNGNRSRAARLASVERSYLSKVVRKLAEEDAHEVRPEPGLAPLAPA